MPDVVRHLPNSKRRLGRYRLIATLGQGGMGTIHLGVAEGIGGFRKLFVIKELKHDLTRNEQFLELFMREARLAARLSHPNVVHTIEADHEDGRYYLAMDFLDGQPFNEVLWHATREPVAPVALRLQVLCQALAGLHHAHELRDYDGRALHVVHRDVSPANIFVGYDGLVKVLDFGIAKAADMDEGTRPGEFKGKISYAAPEQLRGHPADRRVDVFGAGVVLWEALAMRRLVQGKPSRSVFEARLLGTEPRIGQILPDLHPQLAAICDRAMHGDPERRYPTAEAFRLALQDYLAEHEGGVDAALIGRFMQIKFAAAREALHRVIDAELHADAGDPATALISLPPLDNAARALLGRGAQTERDASHPRASAPRRLGARRKQVLLGAFVATALAVALIARWSGEQDNAPDAPLGVREPLPSTDETAAAGHASAAAEPGSRANPTGGAAGAEPASAEPTRAAEAESPRGGSAAPATAPGAEAAFDAGAGGHTRDFPRTTPALRRGAAHVPRANAPTSSQVSRRSSRPRELNGGASAGAPRDAATPAPGSIDLRSVPRHQQRELDIENPFRK
jgi:tRNA A-37 threonylcarbamoyl transferase component Bud32